MWEKRGFAPARMTKKTADDTKRRGFAAPDIRRYESAPENEASWISG